MNGNTTTEEAQQSNYRMRKLSRVGQLFIYTDGSLQNGVGGWAVVVEGQQNSWGVVTADITISGSTTTELFAIHQALARIASSRSWERPLEITIFSDSAEAIRFSLGLHSPTSGTSDSILCNLITRKLDELELSHSVTLKWLKAHAGIEGNELADKLADLAVRSHFLKKEERVEPRTQPIQNPSEARTPAPPFFSAVPLLCPLLKSFPQAKNMAELTEAIWDTFSRAGETKHLEANQPMGRAWFNLKDGGELKSPEEICKLTQGTNLCLKYLSDKPLRTPTPVSSATQSNARPKEAEKGNKRSSSTDPSRPAKTQVLSNKQERDPHSAEVSRTAKEHTGYQVGSIEVQELDPFSDPRFKYNGNPLHLLVGMQVGSRGLLPPVKYRLYPISGFQGSGSADMSFTVALQFLYPDYQFELMEGMAFEILPEAIAQYEKLGLPLKLKQMGSIKEWPKIASKIRVSESTLVATFGGSPCEKISYGALNGHELNFVGPHQFPSNLIFDWVQGHKNLAAGNSNTCVAAMTEMVRPAVDEWVQVFEQMGQVHNVRCHEISFGAQRNRMYITSPHIRPQWSKQKQGSDLWDGAKWPANYTLERYPPCLRSILPALMVRRIQKKTAAWENEQLDLLKVRYTQRSKGNQVVYASPQHWAQWLGWPKDIAVQVAGTQCGEVIDDLVGKPRSHFEKWEEEHRPKEADFSRCGVKRYCNQCETVIQRLGQGWHVPSAALYMANTIKEAADHKAGRTKASFQDFAGLVTHACSPNCPQRVTVQKVKTAQKQKRQESRVRVEQGQQQTPTDGFIVI